MAHILGDSLGLVVSVYTDCSVWEITNTRPGREGHIQGPKSPLIRAFGLTHIRVYGLGLSGCIIISVVLKCMSPFG